MESLLVVVGIVALVCLSILSIYLITVLVKVRSILTSVEKDLKELSAKAIPVFENLEIITDKVRNVAENIDEQIESVKHSISSIKEIANNIVNFERKVQDRIEEPVLDTVSMIVGFFKGVRAFVDRLRG